MTAVHGNVQTCMAAVLHHHVSQIWSEDPHPLFQYIIEEIRVHKAYLVHQQRTLCCNINRLQ
jgi:hypothetical protein